MSNIHSPANVVLAKPSLQRTADSTATRNGTGVDCRGFDCMMAVLSVSTHDRTNGDETLDVKLQGSSDDGVADAYADITSAAFAQVAAQTITAGLGYVATMNVNLK